ncbi:MAG: hypothetical protein JW840_00155 [Candidatus Thermoplasmatota archaeon]|nr:hypothetical protein [Candidatus Thermoplasmatota archaeon]
MRREAWKKMPFQFACQPFQMLSLFTEEEETPEDRSDVCIYKTLRYPPKSTPPAA